MSHLTTLNLGSIQPPALRATSSTPGTFPNIFLGVRTASGQFVTPERALRASASLACIRILCEDLASLPLNLFEKTSQGSQPALDHPLYRLLKFAPNEYQTSFDLREQMVLDMLLYGAFYRQKVYDGDELSALYPLAASRMAFADILQDEFNHPVLRWRYSGQSGQRIFIQDQLWRGEVMAQDAVHGRAITLLAREAIGLLLAAEEQGARLFSNGVQTSIALKTDADLDTEDIKKLREDFNSNYSGSQNAFKTIILDNGLDLAKVGLTAQESQYLEARAFQLADIARIFRIPGVMLGLGDKTSTYASAEQFFQSYVKHTILPWTVRIEQTIQRDLLTRSESRFFAKHDLSGLLRADTQARYVAHKTGIEAGFLSRNEAREMEDLPRVEGLDTFLTPPNSVPANNTSFTSAEQLAGRLAANIAAHETRVLADGKDRQEVYAKLAGYISAKTGLAQTLTADYCKRRAAQGQSDETEGRNTLRALLLTGEFPV